jgi:hypothetical protein
VAQDEVVAFDFQTGDCLGPIVTLRGLNGQALIFFSGGESFTRRSAMKVDSGKSPQPPRHFVQEEWPYEARFKRVNGWRMHYIDEGACNPVVLLHGNPAWGFLYRKFVKPLTLQAGA